jgi:hypothetical protein
MATAMRPANCKSLIRIIRTWTNRFVPIPAPKRYSVSSFFRGRVFGGPRLLVRSEAEVQRQGSSPSGRYEVGAWLPRRCARRTLLKAVPNLFVDLVKRSHNRVAEIPLEDHRTIRIHSSHSDQAVKPRHLSILPLARNSALQTLFTFSTLPRRLFAPPTDDGSE